MVIDRSAVVAILSGEADAQRFVAAMDGADCLIISAASVLEIAMVVEGRYGEQGREIFDRWLRKTPIEIVAVTRDQIEIAREGFRRFGKGRNPAGLNFGDYFSYALAKVSGESLLFQGSDFSKTDVRAAVR